MNEILLEFQPAKVATPDAGKPILTYSVYQFFAMERNFDEDSFLSLLTHKMLLLVSSALHKLQYVFTHKHVSNSQFDFSGRHY